VRIDPERRAQLVAGSRELAQHEHAVVVEARGHVLLGHEVHAVAERGHEHDVGGQVERDHLLAGVAVVQVADGLVADGGVVAVQAPDGQLDVVAEHLVGAHPLATGARDLHERHVLHVELAVGQELAEGLQPMADPLGVVEAVDAEHHDRGVAEALADLLRPGLDVRPAGKLLVAGGVDRDREGLGHDRAHELLGAGLGALDRAHLDGGDAVLGAGRLLVGHGHVDHGALGLVAEQPPHGAREVARVGRALEADDVGAEQPLDDLGAPRELGVDPVGRERDVVEEADREIRPLLAEHLRHELQLVVLHPHRPALGGHQCGAVGEATVDLHVALPPLPMVGGRRDHVVVERPQGVVGEALVVELDLLGREANGDEVDAVVLERIGLVVGAPGPADPRAVGFAHHRLEGRHEAAGRGAERRIAVGIRDAVDRQAVGDDDEGELAGEGLWRGAV
jgi:hypothetical protein